MNVIVKEKWNQCQPEMTLKDIAGEYDKNPIDIMKIINP